MNAVEEQFGFASIQSLFRSRTRFAGKLVAALNRQHPRDLFDVHDLPWNDGIDARLRGAFIVYLVGHHRLMGRFLA